MNTAVVSGEVLQTTTRKREKENAGRCTKKSSKAIYAKKRKYHGKNVDVSTMKSIVPVSLQKVKEVKKVPNKNL